MLLIASLGLKGLISVITLMKLLPEVCLRPIINPLYLWIIQITIQVGRRRFAVFDGLSVGNEMSGKTSIFIFKLTSRSISMIRRHRGRLHTMESLVI